MSSLLTPAPNDGSVHKGVSYTSSLITPCEGAAFNVIRADRGYSRRGRLRRVVTNVVMTLSLLVVLVAGAAVPAQASPLTDSIRDTFCGKDLYFAEAKSDSGLGAMGYRPQGLPDNLGTFYQQPHTAYEKFGMAGTTWTVFRGDLGADKDDPLAAAEDASCLPAMELAMTASANGVFMMTKAVTAVSTWLYEGASDLGSIVNTVLLSQVATVIEGGDGVSGLRDALYAEFIGVGIMMAALYLGYVGLIKRSSTTAGAGALWLVLAVVCGFLVMYNPTIIPRTSNAVVTAVTAPVMNSVTGAATGQLANSDICALPRTTTVSGSGGAMADGRVLPVNDSITRSTSCSLWATFVYTPWVIGQFGVSPTSSALAASDETPIVNLGGNKRAQNWAVAQLDAQAVDYGTVGQAEQTAAMSTKAENMTKVTAFANSNEQIKPTWRGTAGVERIGVAAYSFVAALLGLAVVVVFSATILIQQVAVLVLTVVSPLMFLIGTHPDTGKRILQRWAAMLAGAIAKQVLAVILLSLTLFIYIVLMQTGSQSSALGVPGSNYALTTVLMVIVTAALLKYRKSLERSVVPNWGAGAGLTASHSGTGTSVAAGSTAAGVAATVGVMSAAATGNGAGLKAGAATVLKAAGRGARDGSYGGGARVAVGRGLNDGARTASSATNAVRTRKAADAAQKEADARVEAHQNDPAVYARQKEKAERDAAAEQRDFDYYYKKDDGYTERFDEKYRDAAPIWLQERRKRQVQEEQDVADWKRHAHDPAYRAKVEARHGGIPAHLKDIEPDPAPRPQSRSAGGDVPAGDDSTSAPQPGATGFKDSSGGTEQPGTTSASRPSAEDLGSRKSQRPAPPRSGQPRRPAGSAIPRPTEQGR